MFTQQSAPQCCPISCMTHWIADLWVCVCEGAEYPAITARAPKIKLAPADCVSQCKSTGTRQHYPLCSGNTDSLENASISTSTHTAHIFALYLHYSCRVIGTLQQRRVEYFSEGRQFVCVRGAAPRTHLGSGQHRQGVKIFDTRLILCACP